MSIETERGTFGDTTFEKPSEEALAVGRVFDSVEVIDPNLELGPEVISRLILLELHSKFNHDSRMIKVGLRNVLEEIGSKNKEYAITPERIKEACMAAIIHDVGKSGPLHATPEQQLAVVRLFAMEGLRNPMQTVLYAVNEVFDKEAELIMLHLEGCGIDTETMTMLEFWQSHAKWGFEIIQEHCQNLSETTREIAILHHADKGPAFNFLNLPIDQIPKEALVLGALEDCVDLLRQRAIIALDQYEAQIRRSRVTHEDAVGWVRKNVSKTYGNDTFMNQVLDTMLEMGTEKIFGGEVV